MSPVEIDIPPGSPYVGVVRLAVAALARARGLDEERVEDLRIAVSEACANAVLAHEEQGSDEPVSVRWNDHEGRIVIEVADRGTTAEPSGDEADTQGFSTRAVMSFALMKSLVDSCDLSPREGGGTITRLSISR